MAEWQGDIDVRALSEARANGAAHTVLDVREPQELAICGLPDSLCIPMQEIPDRLSELPREHPLVVMCHHGSRSDMVAQFLRANGFDNVHNLMGGIDAWAALLEPDMPRY